MLRWRLYYDNGSVYDDQTGPWEQAPSDGVLVLRPNDERGSPLFHGCEYYVNRSGFRPYMTNDLGPLLRSLGIIKFGREAPRERYHEIVGKALHDPNFPPLKSTPRRRWTDR